MSFARGSESDSGKKGMTLGLINANPVVHAKKERIARSEDPHAVDPLDIYDILFFFSTLFISKFWLRYFLSSRQLDAKLLRSLTSL